MDNVPLTKRKRICRVMIVDDHPLLRAGISSLIGNELDLEMCYETDSADAALAAARASEPDLVIVDLTLAQGSGLELVKRLSYSDPAPVILVCSMHDETLFASRALAAGARGYLCKQEATTCLITAIRRVLSGRVYLSERMIERLQSQETGRGEGLQDLSDRELQVLEYIGRGLGPTRIAEQLHISIKTVESHRENIKKKLRLESGSELMRYAIQWVLE